MAQLVLQPRGTARFRGPQNYARSVRAGVRLASVAAVAGADADTLAALYPNHVLRLWGSTPTSQTNNDKARALRGRRVGDTVLFYADKAFFARARIVGLFHNPDLAQAVWDRDEDGQTWEHIMALDDVEEFTRPMPAPPILRSLSIGVPLRSLTLVSESGHASVASMLPGAPARGTRSSDDVDPSSPTQPARVRLSAEDLIRRLEDLTPHQIDDVPSRHQPLTLLWAIGRLAAAEDRLVPWREFREAVSPVLQRHGLPHSRISPEYPFWHLRGSGLWDVIGLTEQPTRTPRLTLLEAEDPLGGLTTEAAVLLRDTATRVRAVRTILANHLSDAGPAALLADVGLSGYDSASGDDGKTSRWEVTTSQIIRDRRAAASVKNLYQDECQVCGYRLITSRGTYSEAAHIRGLGTPHNGPDHLTNLLCLCPNHHVQFDTFTIYIDEDNVVRLAEDDSEIARLRLHPAHDLGADHLGYHRLLCNVTTRVSRR